jgi:hypothetical protein
MVGPAAGEAGPQKEETYMNWIMQFNWRKHWKTEVVFLLNHPLVKKSLELEMVGYDRSWKPGMPPHIIGRIGARSPRRGDVSWYQPMGRCHHSAFFSMAIRVLLYPRLTWRFVGSNRHTVPVGFDKNGRPRIVMDILLFDMQSANKSRRVAMQDAPNMEAADSAGLYSKLCGCYLRQVGPPLQACGLAKEASKAKAKSGSTKRPTKGASRVDMRDAIDVLDQLIRRLVDRAQAA